MKNLFFQLNYSVKQAYLSLQKKPGFVFSVVITMGLTMGSLLSILTLAYNMFFKPLPYPEQEQLVTINYQRYDRDLVLKTEKFFYPAAKDIYLQLQQENNEYFDGSALLYFAEEIITSEKNQPKVATTYVSASWFKLLSIPMTVGAAFTDKSHFNDFIPAAILSYETWQKEFGGKEDVLTKYIVINGISHPIVGVTSKYFVDPQLYKSGRDTQVWLPWNYNSSEFKGVWDFVDHRIYMVAKLQKDTTLKKATSLLTLLNSDLSINKANDKAFYRDWRVNFELKSFHDELTLNSRGTILLLFLGVLGLLLIATVNITNLFLARTVAQEKNLAIHAFLGATKKKLIISIFIEIILLMGMAMFVSLLVAQLGFNIMYYYFVDNLPRIHELEFGGFTFISSLVISTILAYFFAYVSAHTVDHNALNSSLQHSGKGSGIQVSKQSQQWLVSSQVTIAIVLIFVNGLLLNDSLKQLKQPLGFNPKELLTVEFSISTLDLLDWDTYAPKVKVLEKKLLDLPQVKKISFARTPLDDRLQYPVIDLTTNEQYYSYFRNVDHHYFTVMQQIILQGDGLTKSDVDEQTPVLLVNQSFAELLANNGEAVLGRKLSFGSQQSMIIGVVQNLELPSYRQTPPRVYVSNFGTATFMLIKLEKNQQLTRDEVIKVLSNTDKKFVLSHHETIIDSINDVAFGHTFTMSITSVLSLLTFLIASVGLYGILSYNIQMRRVEIGTRLAIGAKRSDMIKLIIKDNASAILIGMITSVVILVCLMLVFSAQLADYLNWQLLPIFLLTLGLICLISFIACYLPLRQYINKPAIYSLKGSE